MKKSFPKKRENLENQVKKMTVILEIFTFFRETFFQNGLKNFRVKYYHLKYLGGALDIALHARKKVMIVRGLNQKLSSKT